MAILGVIFVFAHASSSFSAEDLSPIILQAEDALARGNYDQALSLGKRILDQDPRNLKGYEVVLTYCAMTRRETGFYKIIEEAKAQGVSELSVDRLAAAVLMMSGRLESAESKLNEIESKWRESNDKSR